MNFINFVKGKSDDVQELNEPVSYNQFKESGLSLRAYYEEIILDDDIIIVEEEKKEFCSTCQITVNDLDTHEKSVGHLTKAMETEENPKDHLYLTSRNNKGFQIISKMGWDYAKDEGLGPEKSGNRYPVPTVLKRDRLGLGHKDSKCVKRITHFKQNDAKAVENRKKSKTPVPKKLDVSADKEKTKELRKLLKDL